ncbi:MAG: pyridoxal-phosphate dependent enzyme [Bacteroidetes bacterium]|nr:pyridoxal-phosphate dependent enzyme [Bacteroidota bacterium]
MQIPDNFAICQAADRITNYINKTPVFTNSAINKILDANLFFKCENFQKVGAFKFRGATNAVFSLNDSELEFGVATHSSGNHAQALALAAKNRGIKANIVMPEDSSKVKIAAVKEYGGNIIFCKPTLAAREETLKTVIQETNSVEIHPYDNYKIIAGQATATKELIEEIDNLDIIIAPVGGGGLLSGTALATHYFSPKTKVYAAEPITANDAFLSFYSKKFIPSINPQTIADGLRTSLGELTYPIILQHVHEVFTCSEQKIIEAMKLVWERMKIIIEPSSAVALAILFENNIDIKGKRIGIIISGGNVDLMDLPWMNKK